MVDTQMWFGTFHHSEWINRPEIGGDMSPKSWSEGGMYLSGGGFEISAPDAHREFSLEWDGVGNSVAEAARMQAFRDGAYSMTPGDLFYFHDPLSYAVNILPKRWAQPSLMVRTNILSMRLLYGGKLSFSALEVLAYYIFNDCCELVTKRGAKRHSPRKPPNPALFPSTGLIYSVLTCA